MDHMLMDNMFWDVNFGQIVKKIKNNPFIAVLVVYVKMKCSSVRSVFIHPPVKVQKSFSLDDISVSPPLLLACNQFNRLPVLVSSV